MAKTITLGALALALCLSAAAVHADEALRATHAWVRVTAPGQRVAGAYLEIISTAPSKLVAASSPVAGNAEIHLMRLENGVMEMRQIKSLELPAKQTVKLEPGGLHIMLLDLKKPLKLGDKVPLRLTLQRADLSKTVVEVQAEVRSTAP
ncbi:MAG TPA: copper chaperone PCu(A)C [Burkholderiales bacterium]|nr:copper chaperone PCu(A)C [Burkholderiales bacterium]